MLFKAILTGGFLAVLSGSIVYFGTDGADALDFNTRDNAAVEDTELAGAAVSDSEGLDSDIVKTAKAPTETARDKKKSVKKALVEEADVKDPVIEQSEDSAAEEPLKTAEADPIDPPAEEAKPKTKWLDQYLKSTKPRKDEKTDAPEPELTERPEVTERNVDIEAEVEDSKKMMSIEKTVTTTSIDETAGPETDIPETGKKVIKKRVVIKMDGDDTKAWTTKGEDFDREMIEELMGQEISEGENVRVIRLDGKTNKKKKSAKTAKTEIHYDVVLDEARKLQVIDMRNIAFFEIIDYAIDRKDFGRAADILQELSDPELRDTARAKIGVGLAKTGDSAAAFAVLDEMEIDELTASIRLEIITALMATKAERSLPSNRR